MAPQQAVNEMTFRKLHLQFTALCIVGLSVQTRIAAEVIPNENKNNRTGYAFSNVYFTGYANGGNNPAVSRTNIPLTVSNFTDSCHVRSSNKRSVTSPHTTRNLASPVRTRQVDGQASGTENHHLHTV